MKADTKEQTEQTPEELIPLPRLAFQILLALAKEDGHGYGIAKEVERNTGGRTKPSTGSLYLSMVRLKEQGLIEETQQRPPGESDDARRRYCSLTPLGRRVARAEGERLLRLVNLARERQLLDDGRGSGIGVPERAEAKG